MLISSASANLTTRTFERAFALDAFRRRFQDINACARAEAFVPAIKCTLVVDKDQMMNGSGTTSADIFVLETGSAFSFSIFPNGRRHIGDFFGAGALITPVWDDVHPSYHICAKAGTQVTVLDGDMFDDILRGTRDLQEILQRVQLARRLQILQRTRAIITLPALEAVLTVLLDLRDEFRSVESQNGWFSLHLSQQEISDMVGITPVHMSRIISQLLSDGIVKKNGRMFRIAEERRIREGLDYRSFISHGVLDESNH